ncbi:uncharacterized protein isoform X2 [Musca autumnalis]|uniref:uncharacterized protein isoform X2 n=1 Tax=Musca autumnalis TaxID=221902 RepID=UPI003CF979BF
MKDWLVFLDMIIEAEHPNAKFELPIIILGQENIYSLPELIVFPSACLGCCTFYEMILYNGNSEKASFNLKGSNPNLTIIVPTLSIPKRDYCTILLKLSCKTLNEVRDNITFKIGSDSFEVTFIHQPIPWTLFLDTKHIQFDAIKFDRKTTKSFRICNDSKSTIKFHIIFNENKNCNCYEFDHNSLKNSTTEENTTIDKFSWRHFQIYPKCGTLPPNSSQLIEVTFHPTMHDDFCAHLESPPFAVEANLLIKAQDELRIEQKMLTLRGYINGPDIDIIPKIIDFHNVYFGEEQCTTVKVINVDGLTECHVDYHDFDSHNDGNVVIKPDGGYDLKPCQSAIFNLQFFAKVLGKFMIKLQFKVRNGSFYTSIIRGVSQKVRVKCFPDVLDLDIVPICVPQKRLVLIMNPLSVPITVQCSIPNNGTETPLILNVTDTNEQLPITIKDPVMYMHECQQMEEITSLSEVDDTDNKTNHETMMVEIENSEESLRTYSSVKLDDNSSVTSYSTEFQEQALDSIPTMAFNLLYHLKKIKIFDKPEMEKKVVEEALAALLQNSYFYDMDKYKNYCNMDWNALSSDPKEIYCNNEIIYLNPNTGKVISVVVIPNIIGHHHKFIEFRVCPILPPPTHSVDADYDDLESADSKLQQIVRSNNLISKLWIEYNCSVPEIIWDNVIDMQDPLYAGELYQFEMIFENSSKIGGFFYYDAIPDNEYGTMRFLNNRWKYFVEPESITKVPCTVEYKKAGLITLLGLIKFVGVNAGFPFHIKSEVLPPQVNMTPQQITKKVTVLEKTHVYVFIDNITPTTTWFRLKLNDESHIRIYPEGGQLAPTGQGMFVVMEIFYNDPGLYRNTLYIIMQYETIKKIPITIHAEGMPIYFEPNIQMQDLDIGVILCTTENDFHCDNPNYTKVIRVINRGEHSYRIVVTKTKSTSKPVCNITPTKSKILIKPNSLVMKPMSQDQFILTANTCEPLSVHNEFRIDIVDLREPTRKQSSRFVVTAQFTQPQLVWNRREITMDYCRTHKYREHPQWELLKLSNTTKNFIETVCLKIMGPFLLKEHFESNPLKELQLSMSAMETKEIFIQLDKKSVKDLLNSTAEGRISCWANSKYQKSVNIKLNIYTPTINMKHNNITLFVRNSEGGTYIPLYNPGTVAANYRWSKIEETWHYISDEDDSQQVADIIVTDIISNLHLEIIDFEDDSEPNMSKRYQKLRCFLPKLQDAIGIRNILDDIINELDLTHKRYKLDLVEPLPPAEPRLSCNIYELLENNSNLHELSPNMVKDDTYEGKYLTKNSVEQNGNACISKTLYFNKKFSKVPSTSNLPEQSSSRACAYHTLNEILANVKLEDSYTTSEPSIDTCNLKRTVYFFEKSGIVHGKQMEMCALHIPPVRRGYEVRAAFQLQVVGGENQEFRITLVNLDRTLKLNKESVHLDVKPWYEHFKAQVLAENITHYDITLDLQFSKISKHLPRSAAGYIKMLNNMELILSPLHKTLLKFEGIMGFSEDGFMRELRITINNGQIKLLKFRGQGVMPMLITDNPKLPYETQTSDDIINEYRFLQKIFYFEMFSDITELECDFFQNQAEEHEEKKSLCSLEEVAELSSPSPSTSMLDESRSITSRSKSRHAQELRYIRCLLQSYVLINDNEEVPNFAVLNQLLETERFLHQLNSNPETVEHLQILYHDHQRLSRKLNEKLAINLKHFIIQPLPFHIRGIVLDLGNLVVNQFRKYSVSLEFLGPGKLLAAARSVIQIPGVFVDLEANDKTEDAQFIYYPMEQYRCHTKKLYRNMYERLLDAEVNPKIKHAHSFDIDKACQHQRSLYRGSRNRKCLLNFYGSLNKSIYAEHKHHHTYCKISAKSKNNISAAKLNVNILMRPDRLNYSRNQKIEDYLFIDLHMGPTLPILLRGTITDA